MSLDFKNKREKLEVFLLKFRHFEFFTSRKGFFVSNTNIYEVIMYHIQVEICTQIGLRKREKDNYYKANVSTTNKHNNSKENSK